MRVRRSWKKARGLSLIELLAVLGILALLAGIFGLIACTVFCV